MITAVFNLPSKTTLEVHLSRTTPIPVVKSMLKDKTGTLDSSAKLEIGSGENAIVLSDDADLSYYEGHIQNGKLTINVAQPTNGVSFLQIYLFGYGSPLILFAVLFILFPHNFSLYYSLITFCVIFHFAKRILEGFFVHILSTQKMPFGFIFGMVFYYGGLFGMAVALEVYYFRTSIQMWSAPIWITVFALFLLSEFLNFYCHYQLRKLRIEKVNGVTRQVTGRKVPSGLFFDSVISPNYSFEILLWLAFALLFKTYAGLAFVILSIIVLISRTKENKDKMLKVAAQISPETKLLVQKRYLLFPYII